MVVVSGLEEMNQLTRCSPVSTHAQSTTPGERVEHVACVLRPEHLTDIGLQLVSDTHDVAFHLDSRNPVAISVHERIYRALSRVQRATAGEMLTEPRMELDRVMHAARVFGRQQPTLNRFIAHAGTGILPDHSA